MSKAIIEVFNKNNFQISVKCVNNEQLFLAKDLSGPLGIKNIRNKISLLDEDEKVVQNLDTLGGSQKMTWVTEPGLYSLILSCPKSRKNGTSAWKFRRWVCHEVLPSIRNKGSYTISPTLRLKEKTLDMDVIRLTKELFPNDSRMNALVHEKLANMLANQDLRDEMPQTVSELMEKHYPVRVVLKYRCTVGKHVAQKFKAKYGDPPKTTKLVNGHSCKVNAYPRKYSEEIESWITIYMNPGGQLTLNFKKI